MELSLKQKLGLVCVMVFLPALCNCQGYVTNCRGSYYNTPDGYGTPKYCDANGVYLAATTDYGEGDRTDFMMSPRAFSSLGRNKAASEKLKKYGTVDVGYTRVPCKYPGNVLFHVQESSSNPGYFAVLIFNVNGKYDVTSLQLWQNGRWEALSRVYGAVFDFANPPSGAIRLRFQATNYGWVYPKIAIPSNWKPGATYDAKLQLN